MSARESCSLIGAVTLALMLSGCGDRQIEPTPARVVAIAANSSTSCAISEHGQLRCWGVGRHGLLANGRNSSCGADIVEPSCAIGDDEHPREVDPLDVGGEVVQTSIGGAHICALLRTGSVRCWGKDEHAAVLGLQGQSDGYVGDDETPASMPVLDLGGKVGHVAAGLLHTCALLESGSVRCWGVNENGTTLGVDAVGSSVVGDDEPPGAFGDVDTHGLVEQLEVTDTQTCVRVEGGRVRCWGADPAGTGVPNTADPIADWEDVPIDVVATDLAISNFATCVLDEIGNVSCWGVEFALGVGSTSLENVAPTDARMAEIGAPVVDIVGGPASLCAITDAGGVRCWGETAGYPDFAGYLGADATPAEIGDMSLGESISSVAASDLYGGCALSTTGAVRCWGFAGLGRPGVDAIGDDEVPSAFDPVAVF